VAENDNIARQAELLASELFAEFFWERVGPTNHDWPCETPGEHGVATHPCDVVYYYDEPYSAQRTYVHCDLKSYAKGSIKSPAITSALISLGKQVACADKSPDWQEKHAHDNVTYSICGLLFVYNHDGQYDADFNTTLTFVANESLQLPRGKKVFVLGPKEIFWLDNVSNEIQRMRGKRTPDLPSPEYCSYYHPQLVRKANLQIKKAKGATLETLTSPIIILEARDPKGGAQRRIVVFYSRKGEVSAEFIYLIDILRKYELLDERTQVTIKTLNASPNSSPTFQKSQQQYIEGLAGYSTDLSEYVLAIKYDPISEIKTTYSSIDLGTWS
jgi:hypothetical protein